MKKLTRQQEDIICELLSDSENKEFKQELLTLIGEQNWTRSILSSARNKYLTEAQLEHFYSLGGHFSTEEVSEHLYEWEIEEAIAEALENKGVSAILYENRDYLIALREGKETFEGIDIEQIKQNIMEER